jgi:hypothetical protein
MLRIVLFFTLLSASPFLVRYGLDTSKGAWRLERLLAFQAGVFSMLGALVVASVH